jgi:hypothetical protein
VTGRQLRRSPAVVPGSGQDIVSRSGPTTGVVLAHALLGSTMITWVVEYVIDSRKTDTVERGTARLSTLRVGRPRPRFLGQVAYVASTPAYS